MGLLRTLLALSVVFQHIHGLKVDVLVGGQLAVQIFFVISGFYMCLVLNTKYDTPEKNSAFFAARFLRIYPIYWIVLVLVVIVSVAAYQVNGSWGALQPFWDYRYTINITSLLLLVGANLTIIGQDILLFFGFNSSGSLVPALTGSSEKPYTFDFFLVPQAWSIAIELVFYLVAPFILRRGRFLLLIAMTICAGGIKAFIIYAGLSHALPWDYRFLPAEFMFFGLGAISAHCYLNNQYILTKNATYCGWGIVMLLIFSYPWIGKLLFASSALVCLVVCLLPSIFSLTKNSDMDRIIGDLSYPIYMIHLLIIWIVQYGLHLTLWPAVLLIILGTLASAYIITRFIEEPLDRFRHWFALLLISKYSTLK